MSESVKRTDFQTARPGEPADPAGPGTTENRSDSHSVGSLLTRLVDDVAILIRKELALASSEITHAIDETKTGVISLASGGAVLYAGVIFLLLAATLGLAQVMPGWVAALIVGGVVTLIGLIMVKSGSKKMQPSHFTPERATRSVREDAQMVGRHTS